MATVAAGALLPSGRDDAGGEAGRDDHRGRRPGQSSTTLRAAAYVAFDPRGQQIAQVG
ncbi:MAG: hypothetical protein V9H69_10070 [Anaerolineae bacterium]